MSQWLREHLVCPRDHTELRWGVEQLTCARGHVYPLVDGIPVMLLQEAASYHWSCASTFAQLMGNPDYPEHAGIRINETDAVDAYVQRMVANTCGHLYSPLVNKLPRYPIPRLRLPPGNGKMFLDVGSGWGRWCVSAARLGYTPIGIEPSLDAVKAARRVARQMKVEATFLVADGRHLPFAPESFDVVFSYSVLQHFEKADARLSVAEMARVLKSRGACLVQMPNALGVRSLFHQIRRGFKDPGGFGVRYWSLPELRACFSEHVGATALSVDGFFGLGIQAEDVDLLPTKYRYVVRSSEMLRRLSERLPVLTRFADSVYVHSTKSP